MNIKTKFQLSFMMFLEFFIWGGWFVTLGTFLGNNLEATAGQSSMAFSTQSWGAIIAPFIIGLIADRYFNAERILGVLHLIGAFLMYQMYQSEDFVAFYPYVLGYMILYMPTLALVNSISFNQMKDPAKEFSNIRVFGTIGWIVAGSVISYLAWDSSENIAQGGTEWLRKESPDFKIVRSRLADERGGQTFSFKRERSDDEKLQTASKKARN